MDAVEMIRKGIMAAPTDPKIDAAVVAHMILVRARHVEDALRIVRSYAMWKPSEPGLASQRLAAMQATHEYDCIESGTRRVMEDAVKATDSYGAAAKLVLDSVPGAREHAEKNPKLYGKLLAL